HARSGSAAEDHLPGVAPRPLSLPIRARVCGVGALGLRGPAARARSVRTASDRGRRRASRGLASRRVRPGAWPTALESRRIGGQTARVLHLPLVVSRRRLRPGEDALVAALRPWERQLILEALR